MATDLADEFDSVLKDVIDLADSCSEVDWQTPCPNEARTVGVVFDHIASGNELVMDWIAAFLGGQPIAISPQSIDARNAAHKDEAAQRPRAVTIERLFRGTTLTSHYLHGLSEAQLGRTQEFGWLGQQDVAFLVRQGIGHPRKHLLSIREALGR
ncbi:MAG TPA: DinB family protein [Candidatus Dormibacteraeota bacterium]|nr:DinB family protein [Candidatus Dormibacteraeota bacterium]